MIGQKPARPNPRNLMPERQDLGDPEFVKEADGIRKMVKQQDKNDLREIMGTDAGRRFLWRMLGECRMFGESFAGENTHATAHNEGKRSIGRWLTDEMQREAREEFLTMWQENLGENK